MQNDSFLKNIKSPADLKNLSVEELNKLSEEIRSQIVETVSYNGGHLASNLGVVELTVAMHSVFDTPDDKIVWDVGHQCYAHKILTGRYSMINTIRKEDGLSGFPKRNESVYDTFNTGHSSTSISAAYGISCAADINNDKHYTVAVIGDGALSGGLAFEGLNNAGRYKENLIVVLNDNKMSISKNVGSMARYLASIRIKPSYLNAKSHIQSRLEHIPGIGKSLAKGVKSVKDWIRDNFFGHRNNMFEQLGFTYYGPFDGHNIEQLQTAFKAAKRIHGPVIIHACTIKGKGYEFAEKNPKDFHGISAFDIETGETKPSQKSYSDVFGNYLCGLAENDKRLCAITAAMAMGTGLSDFAKKYKNRFFDVGIAEEHAVTFSCGLSVGNAIPVFAVYSTFLQRSYDQILHDAAIQNLHIVLAIDRAGIVGEDGETHQGIFDVAFLNTIPNVTVFSPSSFTELECMLYSAIYDTQSVAAVRYPRGSELYIPQDYCCENADYTFYGNTNSENLIITYGRLFSYACLAKENLEKQGIQVCILKLNVIKPINSDAVKKSLNFNNCYFFEEGIKNGGAGEIFGFMLYQSGYKGNYSLTAIEDYVQQAKTESSLRKLGLDAESMTRKIIENQTDGK
ncbi:MAG: 1-deoxy-D-xylulose-5-phosphate synthase [Acutalibacteraceae bacterium]